MRSLRLRLGILSSFFIIIISWYFIPDEVFVEYSDASEQYAQEVQSVTLETTGNLKEVDAELEKKVRDKAETVQKEEVAIASRVKQSVPFTSQAPHAQWDDMHFQDACEEASLVMANAWLSGDSRVSKKQAETEMKKLFNKVDVLFGDVIDTSIEDTSEIFSEYYGYEASIEKNITMTDMYEILADGKIIIAPTNGKWLKNPNFTNGGPDRHMLVIVGYDKKNGEFITNDPGTRLGKGYKYKDSVLYNAIRDYKTGNKEEIGRVSKNIMVIEK
ncbi:MAG: C39 family peptidase [Patescibacteria group bacterium]